jgi:hypothetical protein
MTPKRDNAIRRRAAEVLSWCESELAITEPWVNPPEVPVDYRLNGEAFRAALEERTRQYRAFRDRPDIRRISEYREWLHGVAAFCRFRQRHPIGRLLKRSQNIGHVEMGEYNEPTSRFSWHWQNLDGDLVKRPHSPQFMGLGLPDLRHSGRAWFDWYVRATDRKPLKIEIDWSTGKAVWSTGVSYTRKNSGTVTLHASVRPIASVYLILKHLWPRREDQPSRTYSLSLIDDAIHYDFGKPGSGDEWHRDDPLNWMRGCRFWMDDVFGCASHSREKIGPPVQAVACLPEGQYTLTLQREVSTWKRPRWPWPLVRTSVDITLERPPEFQGKGENSYDCGPDAIYGMSSEGHSYEDAVAAYVKAVLRERAKRGHLAPEHRTVMVGAG